VHHMYFPCDFASLWVWEGLIRERKPPPVPSLSLNAGCALNIGPERSSTIKYDVLSRDNVEKGDFVSRFLRENKTLGILLLRTLRKVAVLKPYGIVFRKSDCLSGP
jgi:hypothetical protein